MEKSYICSRLFNETNIAMYKIVSKSQYSEKVFKLVVEAPLIAKSRRAGHFVIVRTDPQGERVPIRVEALSHWWCRPWDSPRLNSRK